MLVIISLCVEHSKHQRHLVYLLNLVQSDYICTIWKLHSQQQTKFFLIGDRNIYQTPSMNHTTTSLILLDTDVAANYA